MSIKSLVLAYDRPAPRYTSYPPATQFTDAPETAWRTSALASVKEGARISLYLHIPFCSKLCYYCGCFTSVTRKMERVERYLQALVEEAKLVSSLLPKDVTVAHLHFGGGSPSMLTPEMFRQLFAQLSESFGIAPNAEIAIEIDPRQLSEAKIAAYAACGVNRVSFGVQDFDIRVLAAVNREQAASLSWRGIQWCWEYGINNVNFDLMYGLPHQSVESMKDTVAMATDMAPSRIAFFGYAHVPWMKNHMKAMDLAAMPDASLRYDLFKAGSSELEAAGYHAVGIDHFVEASDTMYQAWRERRLQRNFQGYTTDALPVLIGLGASAISKFADRYVQNKADIALYEASLAASYLPAARGWSMQKNDELHARVIEALMCYFEVDLASIVPSRTYDYFAFARERLSPLVADGIVAWEGDQVRILKEPQLMARLVASAFDQYTPWLESEALVPQRHARAI